MFSISSDHMAYSDKYLLDIIRQRSPAAPLRITQNELAVLMGCHTNTVANIIKRLEAAQKIEVTRQARKSGHIYRLK
jgi:DNA-binding Lrp family transcriptional regulator